MKVFLSVVLLGLCAGWARPAQAQTPVDSAQIRLQNQKERTRAAEQVLADQRRQTATSRATAAETESALKQQRRDLQAQKRQLKDQQMAAHDDNAREKLARDQVRTEKARTRDQKKQLRTGAPTP
ncbi:hypothetical protein [Hymenobacter jeollabukensis]|uniref:DUF4890 domain-containing protein n=1 Tax=Hymenobacter jeollabukensis TaxID=2025313 RepID=A0A5R8WTT7_9BACT|nr:hypothetical protein [Hymenobacter jeollabukensis]TLM95167.1 hypothetical protein FDY95_05070 [Hymenobacter jeollabukensis]